MADTEARTLEQLEKAIAEMRDAETDREALIIAFTELAKLLVEIRFPHEQQP